ncbi:hypothetical protein GCM10010326_13040 [Streptomyces xanthochromogenes]|uniref:Histidine kinase/HSP90-like ATPase domain-containing protein n=1 Tax=Streptomyces xanthochromogenes TaxID=67384 RepID=A0ABQ2ZS01_9ACTN|nr:hypothetical protein GCM10010326_13040 [Streptomyces xanthochromogenes]
MVELAVTELATNVIKHVGEGVPATVVLEPGEGRLRIEVHDTGHAVPAVAEPNDGDECGRGLHLLAALALGWGTTLTATGKAVWCEIAMPPGQLCPRVERASQALTSYRRLAEGKVSADADRLSVLEASVVGLVADLLHWVVPHGCDPDEVLDRAQARFEADAA